MLPWKRSSSRRRWRTPPSMFSYGSNELRTDRLDAVAGMSCMRPRAPFRATARGLNSDSASMIPATASMASLAVAFTTSRPLPALPNSGRTDAGRRTGVARQPGCQAPRFGGSVQVFGQLPVSGVGAGPGTRRHALDTLRDKLDLGLSDRLARQRP